MIKNKNLEPIYSNFASEVETNYRWFKNDLGRILQTEWQSRQIQTVKFPPIPHTNIISIINSHASGTTAAKCYSTSSQVVHSSLKEPVELTNETNCVALLTPGHTSAF